MRYPFVFLSAGISMGMILPVCRSFVLETNAMRGGAARTPPLQSIPNPLDTLASGVASICRLPKGVAVLSPDVSDASTKPAPRLVALYDVENSPACRKVRELITELDLVVETVIPAASNSRALTLSDYKYSLPVVDSETTRTRRVVIPRLVMVVDGQEKVLSGADAICQALGADIEDSLEPKQPSQQVLDVLREAGNYVATLCRLGRGAQVSPSASAANPAVPRPQQPLVLYSYESNQFCRLVREVLTELDLPYQLRSAGKESPRRSELAATTVNGATQCPYLLDPNTNVAMAESIDIIRYLYKTYALWTPPNELLQWASAYVLPLAKPLFAVLAPLQAGASNKDDENGYRERLAIARADIESTVRSATFVVYTYGLSPFSFETKALLDNLGVAYKEVSLGLEWVPLLILPGGSETRAALLEMTGQSSLPHVFIGGSSVGGLYSGTPGLLPLLEQGKLLSMVAEATREESLVS